MTAADYHATKALSSSGMKDLAVSTLRYWHRWINPQRIPEDDKDCFVLGDAVHCAVLEPTQFKYRFVRKLEQADFPGCLVTIADMWQWLKDKNLKPKGTLKAEIAKQVLAADPGQMIWDKLVEDQAVINAGRTVLSPSEFDRVENMAHVLWSEPAIKSILQTGRPEVSIFGEHAEYGVKLKARLDWINDKDDIILDLKSFTTKRGSSVEKSIYDAIYYEGYYRTAYHYVKLEQQASHSNKPKRFILAFVESEEPHDVRLIELGPVSPDGTENLYWRRAAMEVSDFCWLYKSCVEKYGENAWIPAAQEIRKLEDKDIRQLAFN